MVQKSPVAKARRIDRPGVARGPAGIVLRAPPGADRGATSVITSYSIHYTKLYELAWIEHRRADATAALAALAEEDPADATPETIVGETLNELYRFSEALGFLRAAVERDPRDWRAWTQLGRALANVGDAAGGVITSYSIHYTKLYEDLT